MSWWLGSEAWSTISQCGIRRLRISRHCINTSETTNAQYVWSKTNNGNVACNGVPSATHAPRRRQVLRRQKREHKRTQLHREHLNIGNLHVTCLKMGRRDANVAASACYTLAINMSGAVGVISALGYLWRNENRPRPQLHSQLAAAAQTMYFRLHTHHTPPWVSASHLCSTPSASPSARSAL